MSSTDDSATIDDELDDITQSSKLLKDKGQAYQLMARTFAVVFRINTALGAAPTTAAASPRTTTPGPVDSLQGWVQKIREALEALAALLEAQSYTIGVSIPFGLTVQVTFGA